MSNNKQPIEWEKDNRYSPLGWFISDSMPLRIVSVQFSGKNTSRNDIEPKLARVIMPDTGEVFDLNISGVSPPSDFMPAPEAVIRPGHEFNLGLALPAQSPSGMNGLPFTDFVKKYKALTFEFEAGAYRYEHTYRDDELKKCFDAVEKAARENREKSQSGVVKRPTP